MLFAADISEDQLFHLKEEGIAIEPYIAKEIGQNMINELLEDQVNYCILEINKNIQLAITEQGFTKDAYVGTLEAVKYLLTQGIKLDFSPYSLHYASSAGHLEITKFLIEEQGFGVNDIYQNKTPLVLSILSNAITDIEEGIKQETNITNVEQVSYLVKHGAKINSLQSDYDAYLLSPFQYPLHSINLNYLSCSTGNINNCCDLSIENGPEKYRHTKSILIQKLTNNLQIFEILKENFSYDIKDYKDNHVFLDGQQAVNLIRNYNDGCYTINFLEMREKEICAYSADLENIREQELALMAGEKLLYAYTDSSYLIIGHNATIEQEIIPSFEEVGFVRGYIDSRALFETQYLLEQAIYLPESMSFNNFIEYS